ncbi:hypothetical protein TGCAST_389960, partial [Toxoplasma gondii CAST]
TLSSMTCCRYPSESECPAWDAWANPVAEANDRSSLVSEYAACGVGRPHTVLPFSRMSLVAYLRGWVLIAGGEGTVRRACHCYSSDTGARQRFDATLARIVDVLGVAAPHGPAVVWYATRRVHARMDERLPVVSRYAVCLGDARAFCSGAG